MVRMSDVVRGIVRDKPTDAAGQPASPAAPPAHEAPPHHAEPQHAVEMPSLDTLPFEPVFPEMPIEPAASPRHFPNTTIGRLANRSGTFPGSTS